MTCVISTIQRFPIKGLSPERLDRTALQPGQGVPGDRAYAFAVAGAPFDAAAPRHLAKTNFLMLMRDEALARLATRFDPATQMLSIADEGATLIDGCVAHADDRARLENFFQEYLGLVDRPHLVQAEGHMFSDRAEKVISFQNLASIEEFEQRVGADVAPVRFRANIHLAGLEPWVEFGWIGRRIRVGGATLQVIDPIRRCAATTVNPATAERDLNIPKLLMEHYGHMNMGIYVRVLEGGEIAAGNAVEVGAPA